MATAFLGVGSNIERERYIVAGLDALQGIFGELALSSVYDSEAIGFDGQPFLNLVARVETGLAVGELARQLRHIEVEHGRLPGATRFSARQLDIDLLTYDDEVGIIDGVDVTIFDCGFSAINQTAICFRSDGMNLPVFELRPRDLGDKSSGYPSIAFDKDTDFSGSYYLSGNDEAEIRSIFTPAIRSFFKLYNGRYVEGHGDALLYCIIGERIGLGTIP